MKIKIFVAREIQYFEIGIFSFNSYVCYLTRGFIASTRAFNLPTRAFSLLTRGFELVTRGFELVTRGFELATRVLLFHFNCLFSSYQKSAEIESNIYIKIVFYNILVHQSS